MSDKIYTLDEIRSIANPIARRYKIAALYLFGSYARGEATAESDLDFRVDRGQLTDLLGSLCDLTSGSGDRGTPVVLIQNYFTNFATE